MPLVLTFFAGEFAGAFFDFTASFFSLSFGWVEGSGTDFDTGFSAGLATGLGGRRSAYFLKALIRGMPLDGVTNLGELGALQLGGIVDQGWITNDKDAEVTHVNFCHHNSCAGSMPYNCVIVCEK